MGLNITFKLGTAVLAFFGCCVPVYAVSVPSALPLVPRIHQSIDPDFAAWLAEYAETRSPSELSAEEFEVFAAKQRPVEAAVLRLFRVQNQSSVAFSELRDASPAAALKFWGDKGAILQDAEKTLKSELALEPEKRSLLTAILATMVLQATSGNGDVSTAEALILSDPPYTCSQKRIRISQMKRPYLEKASVPEILAIIDTAKSYDSLTDRRKLLDAVASNLPPTKRGDFVDVLRDAGGNLPLLMRRHNWLQDPEAGQVIGDPWQITSRHARKRDCAKASKEFAAVIERASSVISITDTMEVAVNVEQCWRSKNRSEAISFWVAHKDIMKKRFGDIGGSWADLRRGYLFWAADNNKEAADIYRSVLKQNEGKENTDAIQGKAIYTLGKIAESEGDFPKAIDLYGQYVSRFPTGDDFEVALNSMVVARAVKNQWKELIPSLKDFLDQQALAPVDQRPVGNMSFSLFWLGRAYLSLGQPDLAKEMWRRLATEYYSTFYGAMGHYLLEQSSGRVFALEPSRVIGFKLEPLLSSLDSKQKDVVQRSLALLRLGLSDLARCEADELNGSDTVKYSPDVQVVRALVLHASGAWLEAIRLFDALPRTVRTSLPVGFERILFPRRYSEMVNRKSAKLGLDPDLVFAVMRQESVFSKEAMSPVGAMGLMQLMPTTASLELKKLQPNYVNPERRAELHQLLVEMNSLFDPEVNITLGVHHLNRLLEIYKSPVFALTSYNASPAATIKWKRTIATDDLLTFIERIPYKETRAYVKLIMRNYFYYKRWYGPSQVLEEKHMQSIAQDLISMSKNPPKPSATPN